MSNSYEQECRKILFEVNLTMTIEDALQQLQDLICGEIEKVRQSNKSQIIPYNHGFSQALVELKKKIREG